MPKRTLSMSSLPAYPELSEDIKVQEDLEAHVPKFSRLSESPSPFPDMESVTSEPSSPTATSNQSIQCMLPPHPPLKFASVFKFEAHLLSHHTNRCVDCKANFPTSHILDLHQAEQHDPLVAARREKGDKTFGCLIPGCEKVCADKRKRRMHMVDKHGFRKDYDWAMVEKGIDGRSSVLKPGPTPHQRSRKVSLTGGVGERGVKINAGFQRPDSQRGDIGDGIQVDSRSFANASPSPLLIPETLTADSVDSLARTLSALRFVPPSVSRKKIGLVDQRPR